jgi:hypothetical protein
VELLVSANGYYFIGDKNLCPVFRPWTALAGALLEVSCKAEWHGVLPTLGALLIVATVAVNPFMQQLIHIELANPEQGSGLLPVAYDLGKTPVDGFFTGNVTLKAAAYAGFFSPPSM